MKHSAIALMIGLAMVGVTNNATSEPAQPHAPGPVEYMLHVQSHHAKLWLAGNARNWDLAEYQADELKELLEDIVKRIPVYKDMPIGKMIEATVIPPFDAIEEAIKSRNSKAFASAFDKLTAGCNTCHEATKRGFIVVQRPATSSFPNQSFAPKRK
jgi:hypothetical protein